MNFGPGLDDFIKQIKGKQIPLPDPSQIPSKKQQRRLLNIISSKNQSSNMNQEDIQSEKDLTLNNTPSITLIQPNQTQSLLLVQSNGESLHKLAEQNKQGTYKEKKIVFQFSLKFILYKLGRCKDFSKQSICFYPLWDELYQETGRNPIRTHQKKRWKDI